MIAKPNIKKFYFNLNDTFPIQCIFNAHNDLKDSWFDMHYEVEIGVLVSGKMTRQYLDHQIEIGPGDVWICGMWEPHGFELNKVPCEVVVFVIDPSYLVRKSIFDYDLFSPFQAVPESRPQVIANNKEEVLQIAKKAKKKLFDRKNPDWAKLLFFELILTVLDGWNAPKDVSNSYKSTENIQPALRMVFERRQFLSTKKAAIACRMSVSTFRTKFKEFMGLSFSDFALKYRIKGALAQMKNSKDTQETIASHWGFTDASHLQRNIKKQQTLDFSRAL